MFSEERFNTKSIPLYKKIQSYPFECLNEMVCERGRRWWMRVAMVRRGNGQEKKLEWVGRGEVKKP